MHTKHYHPELSKFLDYTPSVTELAYARTMGSNEQELASTPVRPTARPETRATSSAGPSPAAATSDTKRTQIRM